MKVYTLGYQELRSELYVRTLVNAGVGMVLDVREHAWSQRPEFVKTTLQRSLLVAGIQYAHIKAAGNPAANRKTARSAAQCLRQYRHYIRRNSDCLRGLLVAIEQAVKSGRPACLTCYERSHEDCHRSVLIEEIIKLEPALLAIHLEPFVERKKNLRYKRPPADKTHSLLTSAFIAPAYLPFT